MKNVFAVIGMFGTVVLIAACGVVALWVGNILLDVNRAPVVLNTAVQTVEALPLPQAVETAVPGSGINFVVIGGSEPEIVNSAPILPTAGQPVEYESVIDYAEVIAQPTSTPYALSDEQLLACLKAKQEGRRMAPYCPTNPAELLGEGR